MSGVDGLQWIDAPRALLGAHCILLVIVEAIRRRVGYQAAPFTKALAQRLVRKVCPDCRERYRPDPGAAALLAGQPVPADGTGSYLQRGRGCAGCRQTGYRGRTGIYELLLMTDALRQALLGTPDILDLRRISGEQGMTNLKQDGWSKVQAGVTTVEEVLRVVGE